MTNEELVNRIVQLEIQVALLTNRIDNLSRNQGPIFYGPVNPPNQWPNPGQPPFTITCKMADGTTKEIKLDGPIQAQGAEIEPTPYQIGRNLYMTGYGISDIFGAVKSDADMIAAFRGYDDAVKESYE